MTRLVLSFICGVAIPFIYSVVVGPLTNYTDNFTLRRLGYIPIGWPRLLLEKIVPLNSFPFRDQHVIALPCFHYWVEHIFVWVPLLRSPLDYFPPADSLASKTPTASSAAIPVAHYRQAHSIKRSVLPQYLIKGGFQTPSPALTHHFPPL